MITPFHIAFPVNDIDEAREFYCNILECSTGRSTDQWIDFNLYGHQVVAHLAPEETKKASTNAVDGKKVPVRHFGVILKWEDWEKLSNSLNKKRVDFLIEPYIRFKNEAGEQGTFFVLDPSGNALEFKTFKNFEAIFEK